MGPIAAFEIIPAIDLRDGHAVRLVYGDFARETRYSADPVATARRWESLGAPRLHVVDLDGARAGAPAEADLVAAICAAVAIPVEVSGGMRTLEHVEAALDGGAARVQLGSVAIENPDVVRLACERHGDAITVAIDSREGRVATRGWEEASTVAALDLARGMVERGVQRIMATDISRDGALSGPNLDHYRALLAAVNVPVVASGGVKSVEHLRQLAAIGCEGVIVGTALYEGTLDLAEALRELAAC